MHRSLRNPRFLQLLSHKAASLSETAASEVKLSQPSQNGDLSLCVHCGGMAAPWKGAVR